MGIVSLITIVLWLRMLHCVQDDKALPPKPDWTDADFSIGRRESRAVATDEKRNPAFQKK
ncbi:hypothetical protein [Pedobacter soli]|uniref:hypothetical protein n=1 Tax=Pedobacter soli TaxID=390242 RepID=UPI001428ABCA|nr:hypothetical protein [Pedobacter soli]